MPDSGHVQDDLEKAAKFIERFYGTGGYGSIASALFESQPYKFNTLCVINEGDVVGFASYITPKSTFNSVSPDCNIVKFKLLAGDEAVLESILSQLCPEGTEARVDAPEDMENYICLLTKVGFKERSRYYGPDLKKHLVILSKPASE